MLESRLRTELPEESRAFFSLEAGLRFLPPREDDSDEEDDELELLDLDLSDFRESGDFCLSFFGIDLNFNINYYNLDFYNYAIFYFYGESIGSQQA